MNIKSKTTLEKKTGDRIYTFECDPDSPLGEIYDALNMMRNFILEKIKENEKAESKCDVDSEKEQS